MAGTSSTPTVEEMTEEFRKAAEMDPDMVAKVFASMNYPPPSDFVMDPEGTPPPGGVDDSIAGGDIVKNKQFFMWRAMKAVGRKTRRGWRKIKPSKEFLHGFAQMLLGIILVGSLVAGLTWLYTVAPLAATLIVVSMIAQIVASVLAFSAITYVEYRNNVARVVNGVAI